MKKIEDYLLRLLLDCLTTYEFSLKDLDKKLTDLQEVVLMNNQLLGFLSKTLLPMEESLGNYETPLNEELLEELIKHSAELEKWGKA